MRDYLDIIKRNLLSPIVVVIFLLAGALIYVREYRDAWFISVVIVVNSTIGIIQELRAKRVLRQLELMSAPKARLLKDGNVVEVGYDELKIVNLAAKNHRFDRQLSFCREHFILSARRHHSRRGSIGKHN
jgi:magnesium-transporting ATPase (P-type)